MIGPVRRWRRLSPGRRRLLAHALALVAVVRLGLWLLPYARVRSWAVGAWDHAVAGPGRGDGTVRRWAPDDVAWAVGAASRRVPAASCLTQALAAQRLLLQGGCPARLRLGVARATNGAFEAHAWVECDGRVVVGEVEDLGRFTPTVAAGDEP